jgi:CubicO group peptidase (beta-lactamase class C family)
MKNVFYLMLLTTLNVGAQTFTSQIDSLINTGFKQDEPGGVVLVAEKGKVLYERAFGMANLELNVPMKTDMVFCLASMTKQFTAVAILQLVQEGKISLTDTVGKFLPDYPSHLKPITLYQLLTHTGGVPMPKSISSLVGLGRGWLSAEQVMATFKDLPLDFQPGTAFAYSNSGYQLLGLVLEKVTGKPYAEYMDQNILAKADMTHSFYGNDMKLVPNRASCYVYTRYGIENAFNSNVQVAFAAGAIQGTAQDLLKWQQALLSEKFVSKSLLQQAWQKGALTNGQKIDYGFGWFPGILQGSPVVEHGGNMGGFMSDAIYVPGRDLYVVVLFNFRGKLPELLAQDIVAIALGKPFHFDKQNLSPTALQSYAGKYESALGAVWTIQEKDGSLMVEKKGGRQWELIPYAKDQFYIPNTSTLGEIRRDEKGKIVGFLMQTRIGLSRNELKKIE